MGLVGLISSGILSISSAESSLTNCFPSVLYCVWFDQVHRIRFQEATVCRALLLPWIEEM